MSGDSGLMFTANCAIRFSCSERTPMMKKLPRPTASSTIRIWLPGRLSCSTACRNANDFAFASGASARIRSVPARCSKIAVAANPPATMDPMRSDPACHTVRPTRPATTNTVTAICVTSTRRGRGSSRSNNDGFTCRTSSSGTSENNSDTSRPMPSPCSTAGSVSP